MTDKQEAVNRALEGEAEPWAQQEKESPEAFQAFTLYRQMDPVERTLSKVAAELSKSKQLMSRWSARHSWVRRARAWDDVEDAKIREAEVAERRKMRVRHAKQAQTFGRLLMEPAIALAQSLKDEGFTEKFRKELSGMSPGELLALVKSCGAAYPSLMRAERLAMGESTEHIEGRVSVHQVKAVAARIAARAAKYIPEEKLDAFLNDLQSDLRNELGE